MCLFVSLPGCGESPRTETPPQTRADPESKTDADHQIALVDTASNYGLTYVFPEQPRPMRTLEAFGCGCAAFDYDNDGWQDILLVADPYPVLYRNSGDGQFSDVTESTGLSRLAHENWIGCAIGDYDGDGWLDVLFTGFHQLALCHNKQGKELQDVTESAGLDSHNNGQWGAGAGFMDLDGDQWLDLVVVNYVEFGPESKQFCEDASGVQTSCPPTAYEAERGEIWHNEGGKLFRLIPAEQGMKDTTGVGLVLAFADIDADGLFDFYIGNDARNADLLMNLGEMKFENRAFRAGLSVSRKLTAVAAMGADWGDYNRDGLLDLTVTDFQDRGAALFKNFGDGLFTDVSQTVGIEQATSNHLGFGLNWIDFDNDGWLDIAYVNGHVYENISKWRPEVTYRQPLSLMHSQTGHRFVDLVPQIGDKTSRPMAGRGSATLDFNNDGRMDLLVIDYEGPVMLLENQTRSTNHWIKLDLHGASPNQFAYGAQITARSGEQIWTEQVSPSSSYLSSEDPRVHLGLGKTERLDSITVRWPSGGASELTHVEVDRILRIDETADGAVIPNDANSPGPEAPPILKRGR